MSARRVLFTLTRPPLDGERWAERGVELIHAPALCTTPLPLPLDRVRARLAAGAAIVVYSRHALSALAAASLQLDKSRILCVGPRLAERARVMFPSALIETPDPSGAGFDRMVECVRRDPARPRSFIALGLRGARRPLGERLGAEVEAIDAYESAPDGAGLERARSALAAGGAWIAIGSPRAARALAPLVGSAPVGVIGRTTKEGAERAGLVVRAIAREPSAEALIEAIARAK